MGKKRTSFAIAAVVQFVRPSGVRVNRKSLFCSSREGGVDVRLFGVPGNRGAFSVLGPSQKAS
jgi:hypothetical protein